MKMGFISADPTTPFHHLLALAQAAEETGFDSFWLADHFLNSEPDPGFWEMFTCLSAIASRTTHITLGSLVACTAFRTPGMLAKIADTLDEVSQGRFILGVGAGWFQPEFAAFGYPFDHLATRFEEALQVIVPLLRNGQVDFRGTYVQAQNAQLVPRGPTPGGPPILIAANRPRMLQLVARYADAWHGGSYLTPETAQADYQQVLASCNEAGRDPSTLAFTAGTEARILVPGETYHNAEAIVGTVDEVTQRLRGFAAIGVQHLMVLIPENTPELITRFAPVIAALAIAK